MHSINLTQLEEINKTLAKHSAVRKKNPLVTHYKLRDQQNFEKFY